MDYEKLLADLTSGILPYPWDKYAIVIGIKNVYALAQLAGGKKIYIPKPDNLFKEAVKNLVIQEYSRGGCTQEELAEKYNLSVKTVCTYINKNRP